MASEITRTLRAYAGDNPNDYRHAAADRIEALEAALKPFADAVYNDNGDLTVNLSVDGEDLIKAYFAIRHAVVLRRTVIVKEQKRDPNAKQ